MPRLVVEPGLLHGHMVRQARKRFACDGWTNKRGHAWIEPGQKYVETEVDPDRAGGFGMKRACYACCQREIDTAELF